MYDYDSFLMENTAAIIQNWAYERQRSKNNGADDSMADRNNAIEEKIDNYDADRKLYTERAKDSSLPAIERLKAVGVAIADGAKELTQVGIKKLENLQPQEDNDPISDKIVS